MSCNLPLLLARVRIFLGWYFLARQAVRLGIEICDQDAADHFSNKCKADLLTLQTRIESHRQWM